MRALEAVWQGRIPGRTWFAVLLVVGLAARSGRWLADFPFWGDESYLALNLMSRDFRTILEPLRFNQIAPAGFLWGSLAVVREFGFGERATRLIPLVASLGSVLCFAYSCRAFAARSGRGSSAAVLLPLALFAIAYYPIRYAAELKPYAVDLAVATLALALVVQGDGRSEEDRLHRVLVGLAILALPALLLSYPAVFVLAGASLAFAGAVVRGRSPRLVRAFAAFNFLLLAGFGLSYGVVGRAHRAASDGGGQYLLDFWEEAFPPAAWRDLPGWLLSVHTGRMFAYPNGGASGGSTATFLLFVLGLVVVLRGGASHELAGGGGGGTPQSFADAERHRRRVLAFLVWPFALTLGAAWLRLYPYGGHPRISLYLAPAICLLSGLGLAFLVDRLPGEGASGRWASRLLALCCVVALGGMVRDVVTPYRVPQEEANRRLVRAAVAAVPPSTEIVVLDSAAELRAYVGTGSSFEWYVRQASGDRARFGGVPPAPEGDAAPAVVVLDYAKEDPEGSRRRFASWDERVAGRLVKQSEERWCYTDRCEEVLTAARYGPPT